MLCDVVVIGDGVQGLAMLQSLQKEGWNVIVLSKAKNGLESSQSILNHGYMHQGCIFPSKDAHEPSLLKDWPPSVLSAVKGKETEKNCYFAGPEPFLSNFTKVWDSYERNYTINESAPSGYEQGAMKNMKFATTCDFAYNKHKLIEYLGSLHSERVFYGTIASIESNSNTSQTIRFLQDQGDQGDQGDGGKQFFIQCSYVFLCAGSGNYALGKGLYDAPSENIIQKTSNLQMLCVRGPRDILPLQSVVCWPLQIMIVGHPYGETETIYYISLFNKEQNQLVATNETLKNGDINKNILQAARERFFDVMPHCRENDQLTWFCYSAWKNDHPNTPAHYTPYFQGKNIEIEEKNIFMVNPNIVANIYRCAELAKEKIGSPPQNTNTRYTIEKELKGGFIAHPLDFLDFHSNFLDCFIANKL